MLGIKYRVYVNKVRRFLSPLQRVLVKSKKKNYVRVKGSHEVEVACYTLLPDFPFLDTQRVRQRQDPMVLVTVTNRIGPFIVLLLPILSQGPGKYKETYGNRVTVEERRPFKTNFTIHIGESRQSQGGMSQHLYSVNGT